MTSIVLTLQETPHGIAFEQTILVEGSQCERKLMSVIDMAIGIATRTIVEIIQNGDIIEGKNVGPIIERAMAGAGALSVRTALKEAGYQLPGDKKL